METYNAIKLADPENLYTPGFKVLNCKLKKKIQGVVKKLSPAGGYFDYWWKAENLIRSSPYIWVTK